VSQEKEKIELIERYKRALGHINIGELREISVSLYGLGIRHWDLVCVDNMGLLVRDLTTLAVSHAADYHEGVRIVASRFLKSKGYGALAGLFFPKTRTISTIDRRICSNCKTVADDKEFVEKWILPRPESPSIYFCSMNCFFLYFRDFYGIGI